MWYHIIFSSSVHLLQSALTEIRSKKIHSIFIKDTFQSGKSNLLSCLWMRSKMLFHHTHSINFSRENSIKIT